MNAHKSKGDSLKKFEKKLKKLAKKSGINVSNIKIFKTESYKILDMSFRFNTKD